MPHLKPQAVDQPHLAAQRTEGAVLSIVDLHAQHVNRGSILRRSIKKKMGAYDVASEYWMSRVVVQMYEPPTLC